MKKTFLKLSVEKVIFLSAFSLMSSLSIFAQSPSTWDPTDQTTTSGAVGIGTIAPAGWQEIIYCDDQQNGLIITNSICPSAPAQFYPISFDGVFEPIFGPEPGGGGSIPYPIASFTLQQYGNFTNSHPMLWARMQNHSSFLGSASGPYTSRFIVTPDGTSGVNIEVPRATFDVKSLGSYNYPGLIVGRQQISSASNTQHTMFVPLLHTDGYNNISQQYDQGMFFTDGNGINGSNASGSFVIAPWADPNNASTIGGLRIDNLGNLEVHGTTRTTQLNVNLKWWSDFVFEDDYKLMSLTDVEKFINENKHLPNVPSEATLKETGLDVGEMQAIQIQKIEELTLYTITQEKKIKELKIQIETQENEQLEQSKQICRQQKELEELKKKLTLLLEAQLQNK
jgi:hypothetical protein